MADQAEGRRQVEARYANCFRIGHSETEVVLDFGQQYSDEGEDVYHSRIVMSPAYARSLLELLHTSLGNTR